MEKHSRFVLAIGKANEEFEFVSGESPDEVFEGIPAWFCSISDNKVSKIRMTLIRHGLEVSDMPESGRIEWFFDKLEDAKIATWKWKNNKIGKCWTFKTKINEVCPRSRGVNSLIKRRNPENIKEIMRKANAASHANRTHEDNVKIGRMGSDRIRSRFASEEEYKAYMSERAKESVLKRASYSPEEREEKRKRRSEMMKARLANIPKEELSKRRKEAWEKQRLHHEPNESKGKEIKAYFGIDNPVSFFNDVFYEVGKTYDTKDNKILVCKELKHVLFYNNSHNARYFKVESKGPFAHDMNVGDFLTPSSFTIVKEVYITDYMLKKFSNDDDFLVRRAVAERFNTPFYILASLVNDRVLEVRKAAKATLANRAGMNLFFESQTKIIEDKDKITAHCIDKDGKIYYLDSEGRVCFKYTIGNRLFEKEYTGYNCDLIKSELESIEKGEKDD